MIGARSSGFLIQIPAPHFSIQRQVRSSLPGRGLNANIGSPQAKPSLSVPPPGLLIIKSEATIHSWTLSIQPNTRTCGRCLQCSRRRFSIRRLLPARRTTSKSARTLRISLRMRSGMPNPWLPNESKIWMASALTPSFSRATAREGSEAHANFALVGVELMDFNRAWVQPEVDLFLTTHPDLAAELVSAGAPASKVVTTGQPIHPAFASLPSRAVAREKLGVKADAIQILLSLGSQGFGTPERILREILKVRADLEVVLLAGRSRRVEERLREHCRHLPQVRVLGWIDNVQEWMVASDLMISKPGGGTLNEGFACGLPMLAFNPLPGNEERTCRWIEKWGAGIWIKKPDDLAPIITSLLTEPSKLEGLRNRVRELARPHSARDGALAVMRLLAGDSASDSPS